MFLGPVALTSPAGQAMLGYLPAQWYAGSNVMKAFLQAAGLEFDLVGAAYADVVLMAYVSTATTWGLTLWELELGLPAPGALSDADRRQRILRLLQTPATPTISHVSGIAQGQGFGFQPIVYEIIPDYTVWIRFQVAATGPQFVAERSFFRALLPAHLDFVLAWGGLDWDTFETWGWTWDYLDSLGLEWQQVDEL